MDERDEELSEENEGEIIDEMKNVYNKYMSDYYLQPSVKTGPWTRSWIKEAKRLLCDYGRNKISKGMHEYFQNVVKDKYFADAKRNGGRLKRVIDINERKGLPVVAAEDAFDIIWEMHRKCNHGSVTETMKLITEECHMDVECVKCVIKLCPICKKKEESNTLIQPGFSQKVTLEVLDMSSAPDGKYKNVMIYTDTSTGLVQLRPLKEGYDTEVTFKLMNIFADLGLPKILILHGTKNSKTILQYNLNEIFFPCKIDVTSELLNNSKADYIKNLLIEWTKTEETSHWQMGCYDVQWRINNINTKGRIPQQVVCRNNTCENLPTTQKYIQVDAKSTPSNALDIQSSSSQNPNIALFEGPVTEDPNLKPSNSNAKFGSILLNALVQPQHTEKEYDNVELSAVDERELTFSKSSNVNMKVYVNKKASFFKQNVINKDQSDLSNITVQTEPSVGNSMTPVASGSQNHTIDMSKMLPITVEYQKVPLKLEVVNVFPICSVCNTDILSSSYFCVKCMTDIHLECGVFVDGVAAEDKIVCMSCAMVVKKKRIE